MLAKKIIFLFIATQVDNLSLFKIITFVIIFLIITITIHSLTSGSEYTCVSMVKRKYGTLVGARWPNDMVQATTFHTSLKHRSPISWVCFLGEGRYQQCVLSKSCRPGCEETGPTHRIFVWKKRRKRVGIRRNACTCICPYVSLG